MVAQNPDIDRRIPPGRLVLVILSWVGVVGSALLIVFVTHTCRQATQELEVLRREATNLRVESGRIMLERSALAAYSRVENKAVEKLGMFIPDNNAIMVVGQ